VQNVGTAPGARAVSQLAVGMGVTTAYPLCQWSVCVLEFLFSSCSTLCKQSVFRGGENASVKVKIHVTLNVHRNPINSLCASRSLEFLRKLTFGVTLYPGSFGRLACEHVCPVAGGPDAMARTESLRDVDAVKFFIQTKQNLTCLYLI
jgi:hypothetical protein